MPNTHPFYQQNKTDNQIEPRYKSSTIHINILLTAFWKTTEINKKGLFVVKKWLNFTISDYERLITDTVVAIRQNTGSVW